MPPAMVERIVWRGFIGTLIISGEEYLDILGLKTSGVIGITSPRTGKDLYFTHSGEAPHKLIARNPAEVIAEIELEIM